MQAASGYHEGWPVGRGVYHNDSKTFINWCVPPRPFIPPHRESDLLSSYKRLKIFVWRGGGCRVRVVRWQAERGGPPAPDLDAKGGRRQGPSYSAPLSSPLRRIYY